MHLPKGVVPMLGPIPRAGSQTIKRLIHNPPFFRGRQLEVFQYPRRLNNEDRFVRSLHRGVQKCGTHVKTRRRPPPARCKGENYSDGYGFDTSSIGAFVPHAFCWKVIATNNRSESPFSHACLARAHCLPRQYMDVKSLLDPLLDLLLRCLTTSLGSIEQRFQLLFSWAGCFQSSNSLRTS